MSKSKRTSMTNQVMVTVTPANTVRGSIGGGGYSQRRNVLQSSMGFHPTGQAAQASKDAVHSVLEGRTKEKKEISELNTKFADYIQGVKYLEAQIKCLMEENEKLRKMKGYCGDRIKEEYEDELNECRLALDTLKKELSPLQAREITLKEKCDSLEDENDRLRRQLDDKSSEIDKLKQMISDMEGECSTLRLRCEGLDRDNGYLKEELEAKRDETNRLRADFDAAVCKQINAENDRDRAEEEYQFLLDTTTIEINELRELLKNLKSTMPVMKDSFQSSFKSAVAAMQKEYDDRLAVISSDI